MKKGLLSLLLIAAVSFFAKAQLVTIQAANALADGASVTVRGIVTAGAEQGTRNRFLADHTGGIGIDLGTTPIPFFAIGDSVEVVGTMRTFNCLRQVGATSATLLTAGVGVRVFSYPNIGAFTPAEAALRVGQVVEIRGVAGLFNGTTPLTTYPSANTNLNADRSTDVIIRFLAATNITGTVPAAPIRLRGVVGRFTTNCAGTAGYQILPRIASDIVTNTAPVILVALTAPLNNASATTNTAVNLTATATGFNNATISGVRFTVNGNVVSTDATAPYEATFTPTAAGTYRVQAIAFNANDTVGSAVNNLVVTDPLAAPTTIAVAKTTPLGAPVWIRGVVTQGLEGGQSRHIADGSAGMGLFVGTGSNLTIGDSVEVRGFLSFFNCLPQVVGSVTPNLPVSDTNIISRNNRVPMRTFTAANWQQAFTDANLGYVVRFVDADGRTFTTTAGAAITDFPSPMGSGTNIRINGVTGFDFRILSASDFAGAAIPQEVFELGGVLSRFVNGGSNAAACTGNAGYQLIGRSRALDVLASNQLPTARITSPIDGRTVALNLNDEYVFTILANDPDGTVARVAWFIGTDSLGQSTSAPFSLAHTFRTQYQINNYNIIAKVVDNRGGVAFDTVNITFSVVSSAANRLAAELKVAPNPASDMVRIASNSLNIKGIEVMSLQGSVIRKEELSTPKNETTLNLNGLSAGSYMVRVATDKGNAVLRIVKN